MSGQEPQPRRMEPGRKGHSQNWFARLGCLYGPAGSSEKHAAVYTAGEGHADSLIRVGDKMIDQRFHFFSPSGRAFLQSMAFRSAMAPA